MEPDFYILRSILTKLEAHRLLTNVYRRLFPGVTRLAIKLNT